jgi:anamorsin
LRFFSATPNMSPTAMHASTDAFPAMTPVPSKGPALAIGSLVTAQDGKYQALISDLEGSRHVERQMLDRLLDGGRA